MSGIVNETGAKSGVIGTTVGSPLGTASAWVNFNGETGTLMNYDITIRGSLNISSVQDRGSGNYMAVFATAMPNVNHAEVCFVGEWDRHATGAPTTTTHAVVYCIDVPDETWVDEAYISVVVFGD